jgi:hypothetical protein
MNRRQLAFIVLVNGLVSLVIALGVVWVFEIRRPDAAEIAALTLPRPEGILAATPPATVTGGAALAVQEPQGDPLPAEQQSAAEPVAASATDAATDEQEVYTVQTGDSLLAIATRYNITVDQIMQANGLTNPDFVFSGQRLVIPVSGGASPTPTPVVIEGVEIAAVDGGGDLDAESVLVVNDSDSAFSLQGWQLAREGGPAYTFGNVPLFPGGSVRVHTRAGSNTSVDVYWGQSEAVWQSGTVARLISAQGAVVHSLTAP